MSGPRKPRKGIKRAAPLSRSWLKPARTKPKASNPARKVREFARTYHSVERVTFVRLRPCCWCVAIFPFAQPWLGGKSENAHTVGGGAGRKAGYETIAELCHGHHRAYDEHKAPFDDPTVRAYIAQCAADTQRAWLAFCGEEP